MKRAFLVDGTGKVEPIQIEGDDGVRKYFAAGDDVYGKTLQQNLDDNTAVRVWRTRDEERAIEIYTAYDRKTLATVDLLEIPNTAKSDLEVRI